MTEPFVIKCETCGTRLRVRSAAAVGAILACPKCQSLVHVARPEQSGGDTALEGLAPQAMQAGIDPPAPGLLPIKIAAAVACLTVIAVAAFVLVPRSPSPAGAGTGNGTEAQLMPREAAVLSEDFPKSSAATDPGAPVDAVSQATASAAEALDRVASGSEAAPAEISARPPTLPSEAADATPPTADPPADDAWASVDVPSAGLPQLDFGFPSTSAAGVESAALPQEATVSAAADPGGKDAVATAAPPDPPAPPASSSVPMFISLANGGLDDGAGIDPHKALALPLADVALEGTSTLEVVRLIADLTGATITVTPAAFRVMRQPASAPVATRQAQITAGEVLTQILQERGLRLAAEDGHLLVIPAGAAGEDPSESAPSAALAEKLQRPVTFTFTVPTPLGDILRHVEHSQGLTLLVDWSTLAEQRLAPESLVTTSVVEQPLDEVLDGLLPQLGLRWSPLDDAAVWITAP